jgi:polyketide synthase PksL
MSWTGIEMMERAKYESVLGWIAGCFASVFGCDARDVSGASELEELGLESMSVVAMGRQLEALFPALSRTFLYDCRTVSDVAAYLVENFPSETDALCASLSGEHTGTAATTPPPQFGTDWPSLDVDVQGDVMPHGGGDDTFAVVGMAGRYPGSPDLESFLDALRCGRDAVTAVPPVRWESDGLYQRDPVARTQWASSSRWGGFLPDVDAFDAAFFGISAFDADVMDPQERLFLECAWHALEHAGLGPDRLPRSRADGPARVGVFAGVTTQSYPLLGEPLWRGGGGQVPTSMPWSIANRVSYLLDFDGPSIALDTACSSSLTALHLACESLRRDECAVALAGGVNLYLHPSKYVQLSQQRMLSPSGHCHAFGDAADGFVPGEGVGVVVLRRLSDAQASGDRILGVIRATGIAHGGRTNGYTVPSSRSQAVLIRDTLARAGIPARRISCVEAHGTGTGLGDPVEVQGLLSAYGDDAGPAGSCALGSVKAGIGHLESAAGVAGLTKLLLQLGSRELFPSLHSSRINPAINLAATPFRIPQQLEAWPSDGQPRCAALSSFGAGGANAHVIVEEWPHEVPACGEAGPAARVYVFSATDEAQLSQVLDGFRSWLERALPALDVPDMRARIAATLQTGRTPLRCRLAVVAENLAALQAALVQCAAGEPPPGAFRGVAAAGAPARGESTALAQDSTALARAWVKGGFGSWAALWPAPVVPLDLPRYPFRRTRHWIGGGQAPAPSFAGEGGAAASVMSLGPDDWRAAHHIVDGHPVFPAAGFLQLLAQRAAPGDLASGLEFRDLMWGRALTLDTPARVTVDLADDGRCAVRAADAADGSAYLRGVLRTGLPAAPPVGTDDAPDAPAVFDRAAFYARFARMGLQYGPTFQPVRTLGVDGAHAWATLSVTDDGERGPLDPALLDGVFQCALALAPGQVLAAGQAFVPFSMRRFALYAPLRHAARVRVSYRGEPASGLYAFDFRISGPRGEALGDIEGFCFRAYGAPAQGAATPASLQLLRRVWTAAPVTGVRPLSAPVLVAGHAPDSVRAQLDAGQPEGAVWLAGAAAQFRFHAQRRVDLDIADPAHRKALIELLQQQQAFPDTLLWLAGHDAGDAGAMAGARRFALLAQALVGALGARTLRIVYVHPPGEDGACAHAAMDGLLKSVHLESPRVSACVVELDVAAQPDALVPMLASAVVPGPVRRLRASAAGIEQQRLRWLDAPGQPWLPTRGATYVITGGTGALGRIFARWLTTQCGVNVALLGRRAPDGALLAGLAAGGASAIHVPADVTDAASLGAALHAVRSSLGPIRGVIHAAGVLRDAFFVKHDDADWQAVLRPKVDAARLLDEATRDDALEAFVLFSSLAGTHGNVGQSVYACANAWLDEFAVLRERAVAAGTRHGRSLSIAWPLWQSESGMQAPAPVMQWMAQRGLELLTPALGIEALQIAMAAGAPGVVACSGRRDAVAALLDVDGAVPAAAEPPPSVVSAASPAASSASLSASLVDTLSGMLASACGVARSRVAADTPLQSLGLDSIMVMDLNAELDAHFDALPKTLLFEADTVGDLASRMLAAEPDAVARFVGAPAPAEVSAPIAQTVAAATAVVVPVTAVAAEPAPPGDDHGMAIAIVGIAGRYPRASDLQAFWRNLSSGLDCVSELSVRWPHEHAVRGDGSAAKSGAYARWAALMDEHDCFDPLFFGIAPRDAERMDPQERLFLEASWLAIEDAGYTPQSLQAAPSRDGARGRVGVLAGVMYGEYQFYGAGGSSTLTNSSYASIANRVSYTLGFNGPSFALDSMCSSSLTAIHTASLLLRAGECDAVLAGGVNVSSHPYRYRMLSELQFAASDGRCRSFGAGGDGYVPGEGVGVVVLKRLADALRDGDHIHGVIRGSAIGHGGRTSGFTVPTPVGQSEVIRDAFAAARVEPQRLGYIEAHGTGTSLGDPIELRGLALALEDGLAAGAACPIGSVKSQIGHLESAAGIAALTKVLLQMRHGRLVPSIHSTPANPNIDFSRLPFRVQAEGADWPAPRDATGAVLTRIAAVSSFGAGGSNAHLVVEEGPVSAASQPAGSGPHIVVLSARTPDALRSMARSLADFVESATVEEGGPAALRIGASRYALADMAATLREARVPQSCRMALVTDDLRALPAQLRRTVTEDVWQLDASRLPAGVFKGVADAGSEPAPGTEVQPGSAPDALARAWACGGFDDWSTVRGTTAPHLRRRVPLPGTAFQRRRFWAQPVTAAAVPAAAPQQAPADPVPVTAAAAAPAARALSPRDIYEQVVRGQITPDEAKALLGAMQRLTETQ